MSVSCKYFEYFTVSIKWRRIWVDSVKVTIIFNWIKNKNIKRKWQIPLGILHKYFRGRRCLPITYRKTTRKCPADRTKFATRNHPWKADAIWARFLVENLFTNRTTKKKNRTSYSKTNRLNELQYAGKGIVGE